MSELEGKTLGRYELRQLIGKGGMADVYKSYDMEFKREIAVKVFKHEEEQMLHRFVREAQLMNSLSNQYLVPIYDSGSGQIGDTTWYYIAMRFMQGGNLQARIRRLPLSLTDACIALGDIADTLDYIHSKGIVHRDIKSSNILLDAQGRCFLSDLGIARTNSNTEATRLTRTGIVLGTVDYIAPELFETNRKADPRSDIYSLGVLLFEMVTGQMPFSSENQIALVNMHMNKQPPAPSSIQPLIPDSSDRVILQALAKNPEQRYGSASALASAFCRAVIQASMPRLQQPQQQLQPLQSLQPVVLSSLASGPALLGAGAETEARPVSPMPPKSPVPTGSSVGILNATQPPRRRWSVFYAALIALVVLLLVTISAGVGVYTHFTGDATATAQSQTTTATAAAIAVVTATARAQGTATAGPLATATGRTPNYSDAMSDSNNATTQMAQWDGLDGINSQCIFKPNGYHVITGLSNLHACQESGYPYGDAALSVDVTIVQGDSGGLFLRFRSGNGYTGYLFEIDSNSKYKFSIFQGRVLQDWTPSSALKTGYNVTNTITVIMKGDTFAFYANGTYITTQSDVSYTYVSGNVALFASAPYANTTEVLFSNLKVYPIVLDGKL